LRLIAKTPPAQRKNFESEITISIL